MNITKDALRKLPGYMGIAYRNGLDDFDDCEEMEIELSIQAIEKERKQEEFDLKRKIKQWADTMPEFKQECRSRYLTNLKKEYQDLKDFYIESYKNNFPRVVRELIANELEPRLSEIKKIERELKPTSNGITQEMIDRAKEYPIEDLIEVNERGFAKCVNHDDNNPSMYCKNGFVYCFSCGYSNDAIGLAMDVWGEDFISTIKKLN